MHNIIYTDTTIKIVGQKFTRSGNAATNVLTYIYNPTTLTVIENSKTTTDQYGMFSIEIAKTLLPAANYELRFYGSGLIPKLPTDGDWETFVIPLDSVSTMAPSAVYRGVWTIGISYLCTSAIRDIVKYGTAYYYCVQSNTASAVNLPTNSLYWTEFSNTFSSVATDLLLGQNVTIAKTITLGSSGTDQGVLESGDVLGPFTGDGFYLANTTSGGGVFRIGTVSNGSLVKGIVWDGPHQKFYLNSANTVIDEFGNLWSKSGGFGGIDSSSAKVNITSSGLIIKNNAGTPIAYFVEADDWPTPESTEIVSLKDDLNYNVGTGILPGWAYTGNKSNGVWSDEFNSSDPPPGANNDYGFCVTATGPVASGIITFSKQFVDAGNFIAGNTITFTYWSRFSYVGHSNGVFLNRTRTIKQGGTVLDESSSPWIGDTSWTGHIGTVLLPSSGPLTFEYTYEYYIYDTYGTTLKFAWDELRVYIEAPMAYISNLGLYVYNSPINYIKLGKNIAEFKINDVTLNGVSSKLIDTERLIINDKELNSRGFQRTFIEVGGGGISEGTHIILDSIYYELGSNKLLVFLDGALQLVTVDYDEVDSTTIFFNKDLTYHQIIDVMVMPF
jgi:hypothetical protein